MFKLLNINLRKKEIKKANPKVNIPKTLKIRSLILK
jgi:hypothetical protein